MHSKHINKISAFIILLEIMEITPEERLNLKKLINETECEDNTATIRKLKHSVLIRDDIRRMERLKKEHAQLRKTDHEQFFNIVHEECRFLFDNYMDIFTRCMKDEVDITIMSKLLIVLKLIEDDKLDQHDGSVMVGRYLKDLYLDSAVKRADNMDKENAHLTAKVIPVSGKPVSWREYKAVHL